MVQQNQSASSMGAQREFTHARIRDGLRQRKRLLVFFAMRNQYAMVVEQVGRQLGHHDFHDAFAVSGAGNSAGFRIGVAATADQRGVAHAAGEFAAGASGRRRGKQTAVSIESHGTHGARFVPHVMFGSVGIFAAA